MNSRLAKAKINIVVSFICQILAIICGFIIPQVLIRGYGSELYGLTSSITQFLAFITLLEGGVAGVARAALYKPLADNDNTRISAIVREIQSFFRRIGTVFCVYVVILACVFQYISKVNTFDWLYTATMVVVISISTFAQYFIGISYTVLLQADQRQYITNVVNIITMVINTILIVVLVRMGFGLIVVKLASSLIFVCRPLMMLAYVRRYYTINSKVNRDKCALSNKWTAFGQHVAYFLHSNTDIAVLTIFGDLKMVAVYSVYQMVVVAIQSITQSFTAGMEAVFGDMLAKNEMDTLKETFSYYDTLVSFVSVVFFSITAVLIIPFVRLYTDGVTDANYIAPSLATLLIISGLLFCLRLPYHSVIMAAGHFRETRIGAYGEAIINTFMSITLVVKFGLVGVAIGTVAAVSFRFIYYVFYLSKHIFLNTCMSFFKRTAVNSVSFVVIVYIGNIIVNFTKITGYFSWILAGGATGIIAVLLFLTINYIFYMQDMKQIACRIFSKRR